MDVVSQLIEENVRRAQEINYILDKNQSQLNDFRINTEVLAQRNYYSESIINSFNTIFDRVKGWFYKKPIDYTPNITYNTNPVFNHKTELKELKELSRRMNNILEDQNNELQNINHNLTIQDTFIKKNNTKINELV